MLEVKIERETRWLFAVAAGLALASLVGELWLIGRTELVYDEAYYTLWSRHLVWGYYDHPPMVAAWIRASTTLFGPSEFGVRALDVFVFGAMPALVGWVGARLFDSGRAGLVAASAWLTMPLVAGAFIATPDSPLVLFICIGFYGLVEVWRGRGSGWWLVGLGLGLAALTKLSAAFFFAGVGMAVVATPSLRRWLRSPEPYAAAALALAIAAPFLIWNAEHGWLSFGRQLARVPPHQFAPHFLLDFFASQFGLANPFTFVAAAAALTAAFRRSGGPTVEAVRLPALYGAPMVLYLSFHALHSQVQGNWPGPLYPLIAILAGAAAIGGPPWAARSARIGVAFGAAAIALLYLHAAAAWPSFGRLDPLARFGGWREVAHAVDVEARAENAAYVVTSGYAAKSLLTYYGDDARPVLEMEEPLRWVFQPPPPPHLFDAAGVAVVKSSPGAADDLKQRFRSVQFVGRVDRKFGETSVETYELYRVADPIAPIAP